MSKAKSLLIKYGSCTAFTAAMAAVHVALNRGFAEMETVQKYRVLCDAFSIGGIRLPKSEHVVLDDGLFEVDLIKKPVSIADVANGFQTLLDQTPMSAGARVHFQASHLIFTCDKPIPWTIDGEYGGNLPVNEVMNCQKALTIIRGK